MIDLRTEETHERYEQFKRDGFLDHGCNLCKMQPIKEFEFWKIINNDFPWDLVFKTNHMLIPKRHIVYNELNEEEKKEFDLIKSDYVDKNYGLLIEATNTKKSIPSHFHIHLIVFKD
jgi:hypothetical protein